MSATTQTPTLLLPSDRSAPGIAREYVREVLAAADMGDLAGTAELVVSELVTNAVVHVPDGDDLVIEIAARLGRVVVGVWDTSPDPPAMHEPVTDDECGRGLTLVDALAEEWDWYPAAGGKTVWAEIAEPM